VARPVLRGGCVSWGGCKGPCAPRRLFHLVDDQAFHSVPAPAPRKNWSSSAFGSHHTILVFDDDVFWNTPRRRADRLAPSRRLHSRPRRRRGKAGRTNTPSYWYLARPRDFAHDAIGHYRRDSAALDHARAQMSPPKIRLGYAHASTTASSPAGMALRVSRRKHRDDHDLPGVARSRAPARIEA